MRCALLAVLLTSQLCCCFSQTSSRFDSAIEKRVEIMLDIADMYQLWCIRLLYSPSTQLREQRQQNDFHMAYNLMGGRNSTTIRPFRTVSRLSFRSLAVTMRGNKSFDNCFTSLQAFETNPQNRDEFSWLCYNFPEVSLYNKWLVFVVDNFTVDSFFRDIPVPFDTSVIAVVPNDRASYTLLEIHRINRTHPIQMLEVGQWSEEAGMTMPSSSMYQRRTGLSGMVIKTGFIQNWPSSEYRETSPASGKYELLGLFPQVWRELEILANFTSHHIMSVDNSTGICDEFECNGLVGMLVKKEIDGIVSELNINNERTTLMDFSQPLIKTRYQVYFRLPGYSPSWWGVLKPFDVVLWVALLAWLALAGALLALCHVAAREPPCDIALRPSTTVFFILQSLCHQGYDQVPRSGSSRLVFVLTYLMGAIILPAYSASLISSLTTQNPSRPFDSLPQMLKYNKYKLFITRNTAEYSFFAQAAEGVYRDVYNKLVVAEEKYQTGLDLMQRICDAELRGAWFRVESTTDYMVQVMDRYYPECRIIKFRGPLGTIYQGIGYAKNYPYRGYLDFYLRQMRRVGIVRRIQMGIWPHPSSKPASSFKHVGLPDVAQIFVVLSAGAVFSVLLLALEIYVDRRHQRRVFRHLAADWAAARAFTKR